MGCGRKREGPGEMRMRVGGQVHSRCNFGWTGAYVGKGAWCSIKSKSYKSTVSIQHAHLLNASMHLLACPILCAGVLQRSVESYSSVL